MQEIFNPDRIRNNIEKIKTVYSLFNDEKKHLYLFYYID